MKVLVRTIYDKDKSVSEIEEAVEDYAILSDKVGEDIKISLNFVGLKLLY